MKILLIVLFIILILVAAFCLWVLVQVGSLATDKEEQMELERKLRERNDK